LEVSDTLMRQWQMLRMIPWQPIKVSTAELVQRLSEKGFDATQRTIQRDLVRLSELYPLTSDERNKPYGWSWMADAKVMDIPGMDSHTALAFWLAEKHLDGMFPKATLRHLQAHFKTATNVLDSAHSDKGTPSWRNKVRVMHRGPGLRVPVINPDVQACVYDSLLRNYRFEVVYKPRESEGTKTYGINPLGIVLKDGLVYLVCTIWDYTDIKLLTLHRMLEAKPVDVPVTVPDGFNLDAYIESGELDFAIGGKIQLKARFRKGAAFHLEERPLSSDQTLAPENDEWMMLSATVLDTSELRWWLLGFGDQIEVLEPAELREHFAGVAASMAGVYG